MTRWFIGTFLLLSTVAAAAPGDTELVSISENAPILAGAPNGPSAEAAISADGRYMAFVSSATNFVSDDTNRASDIFVFDRATGETTRVSVATGGEQANANSFGPPSISTDGRFIAFSSSATNLVRNDTNGVSDIFLHDRVSGETRLVSVSSSGGQSPGHSESPSISADGRFVAFTTFSDSAPEDPNPGVDLFVHDRQTGTTTRISTSPETARRSENPSISGDGRYVAFEVVATGQREIFIHDRGLGTTARVSVSSAGGPANASSANPVISGDGRYVAFESFASNLVEDDPGDGSAIFIHDRITGTTTTIVTPAEPGYVRHGFQPAIDHAGRYVVFMFDRIDQSTFTSSRDILVHDLTTGLTALASVDDSGNPGNRASEGPSISGDGRYVGFESSASNLVENDSADTSDIFMRDQISGTTIRVETEPYELYGGNGASDVGRTATAAPYEPGGSNALSADGRYAVLWSRASTIVSGDTNGHSDVFVRDLVDGSTTRVSVDSSGGEGDGDSYGGSISADGRYVAFSSNATNLVPGDTNGLADVFVHDRDTGATTPVSVGLVPGGVNPNISADGRYVVFETGDQVYVHDRETSETSVVRVDGTRHQMPSISGDGRYIAFVAGFPFLDIYVYDRQTRQVTRITDGPLNTFPTLSYDGRFVAFTSSGGLTDPRHQLNEHVYLHDRGTGATRLMSVDSAGNAANGDSSAVSISADGRFVAFASGATNLVSDDTNGIDDIFVHDRLSQATIRVSVDSDGLQAEASRAPPRDLLPFPRSSPGGSVRPSISADGTHVLFASDATNLTPLTPDLNGRRDVFVHELAPPEEVKPFTQDGRGLVSMEAEHFYLSLRAQEHWQAVPNEGLLGPWMPVSDRKASGAEAIRADPTWPQTRQKSIAPTVGYSIHFNRTGSHYVWVRARATSSQGDTFGLGIDQQDLVPRHVEPDTGQWVWNRGWTTFEVPSPGRHTLWLYRMERRVEIDKIVVTPHRAFTPVGKGPAESPRRDTNASPILEAIGDKIVRVDERLELTLKATDADGDRLTFGVPDLPPFADLRDHGDGTATLSFSPGPGFVGTHAIKVTVTDTGTPNVSDEEIIDLTVVGAAFQQGAGGMLTIESEHFDVALPGETLGPWSVIHDPGASRGQAMKAAGHWARSPVGDGPPRTEYWVHFNRTGIHHVWVRARSFVPSSDAFYVGLDDGPALVRHVEPDTDQWVWNRGWNRINVDRVGLHTFRIYRLERNVEIDKIVITPWPGYTPMGIGPGESRRR